MSIIKKLFSSPRVLLPREASTLMLEVGRGSTSESQASFKMLYEHYKGPIMSYLMLKLRNKAHAEEITQEVFFRVYRARGTYSADAPFSSWLWAIAKNTATDFLRKKKEILVDGTDDGESPQTLAESAYANLESELPTAEAQLIEKADRARLEKCISELSPTQQEALSLRTLSELSYELIAEELKFSLSALKSTLHRAKERLIACLEKEAC